MNFDDEYFRPEVRDGFLVSSRIKRTWASSLEVFDAVRKLCEENNITYYADWGTLLGAVRHGGFIPWDDDFDICMKRDDYMRFIEIGMTELPDGYSMFNVHTRHEYDNLITRVVNCERISFTRDFLDKYHGFPYNAGIDVFPLDYVSDDPKKEESRRKMVKVIKGYIDCYGEDEIFLHDDWMKSEILKMGEFLHMDIVEGRYIRKQLYQLMEIAFSIFGPEDGKRLASVAQEVGGMNKPIDAYYYDDIIQLPFENTYVNVPLLYDSMLEIKYPNYMKVVKDCAGHEYPLYKFIEEDMKRHYRDFPWKDYEYKYAENSIQTQIEERKKEKTSNNKDVVFLPYRADSWKYMEPLWLSMIEDDKYSVYVIPIPFYDKNSMGGLETLRYEGNALPDYVQITPFDHYDLEERHPSKIIIQNTYDQFDSAVSVPPIFYSERIKDFTDCLTCVPEFVLDDIEKQDNRALYNLRFSCINPGVINADIVYVQSDAIRSRYIEMLTEYAGENTMDIWEKKIIVADWIQLRDDLGICEEDIPDFWWPKLLDKDGNGKIVILYYNSISCLAEYGERYFDKMRTVFRLFSDCTESLTVMWHPDQSIFSTMPDEYSDIVEQYKKEIEKYSGLSNVILDLDENFENAVAISDAFYGDRGVIMHKFELTHRPIMIQNVEI